MCRLNAHRDVPANEDRNVRRFRAYASERGRERMNRWSHGGAILDTDASLNAIGRVIELRDFVFQILSKFRRVRSSRRCCLIRGIGARTRFFVR